MNLVDMARRRDRNLLVSASLVSRGDERWRSAKVLASYVWGHYVITTKRTIDGIRYRGFDLSADGHAGLIVQSPCSWYPFRLRTPSTGWEIVAIDHAAEGRVFDAVLRDRNTGGVLAKQSVTLTRVLQPVQFPTPPVPPPEDAVTDLELRFSGGSGGRAFLAVHRILDRSEVLALCRGKGVELGPGPRPQVLPNETREVLYIEQSPPDRWNRLYNEQNRFCVDKDLWSRYTIGDAYPLPVEDDSLDFIFSSHLFEHLANPLGHLEHWHAKLRQGGVVVGIVPDVGGSKDYVFEPCHIPDLLGEYAEGIMQPQLSHYQRWAVARAPGKDPSWYWRAQRSIHVHFYTIDNMKALLEIAVKQLGFRSFRIWYTPNHKDFYFLVEK